MADLLRSIYPEPEPSPYDELNLSDHPDDMQGWGSNDPIFEEVISKVKPSLIVEVGSWKGASAVHMAKLMRQHSPPEARLICVDTWLGSPEHFLSAAPGRRSSLRMKNGYPQLYYTFLCNMVRQKVDDIVIPLPQPSLHASIVLRSLKLRPNVVYIDAGHDYDSVMQDITSFWPLLSDRGVMIGDDFLMYHGVTQAVVQFARDNKLALAGKHGKFVLSKNPDFQPRVVLC